MVEVLSAVALCFINFISGIVVYRISISKSNKKFSRIFFTSILLRYVINLFLFFVFLKYLEFQPLKFALTFMLATFVFLMAEIFYLNSQFNSLILQNKQNGKLNNE
jgi:hypothetical protein